MAQYSQIRPLSDQIIHYPAKEEKRFPTEWPLPVLEQVDSRQDGREKSTLRTSGTHKLPLGYTHTRWASELNSFQIDQRKIIAFSNREVFKLYTVKEADTATIDEVIMAPDFSSGDILDLLLAEQNAFLRPATGRFYEKYLEWATYEKIDENFVTMRSLKERKPFFSRSMVSSAFYVIRNCNFNGFFEQISTGRQENNLWLSESIIVQKDCKTNALINESKWTYSLNADIQRVEEKYYTKENDAYRLDSHSKWEYNDQKLEKTYISVLENKKYEFEYDEFNGMLVSSFNWNGIEWVQNARTIREITPGPDKMIVLYTYQTLVNDNWKILYNETRHLDSQNRQIFYSSEYYNRDTQQLTEGYYFKNKFDNDHLVKESEYFNSINGKGQKAIYVYDDKDGIVQIETQLCASPADCLNGLYQPDSKVEYSRGVIDSLDYQKSSTYTDGNWRKSDSLANLYDKDGDLIEMYTENFALNKKERIRFNYKQDLVTGLREEEPINLTFYPNPTDGALIIETQLSSYTLSLYDLNGRLLGSYLNPGAIDMAIQPPGMYLILIEANGKLHRQKVIRR